MFSSGNYASTRRIPFSWQKSGTHYTTRQMDSWFAEILKSAGIDQRKRDPHERGACLHCFRHLFVLKSMQQLESAGHSVDMNDLLLPTYLGHECLLDTDKYMRFPVFRLLSHLMYLKHLQQD